MGTRAGKPEPLKPEYQGKIVSILDGDTIEVLHNHHAERIRLNGIDCPEKGQAYGKGAKQATSACVFGKQVTLQTHGLDKYGRTIADVLLPDGTNVNHALANTAGAGGIGSMRRGIRCWKGWRRKHEKLGRACGRIRNRCRRWSGIDV